MGATNGRGSTDRLASDRQLAEMLARGASSADTLAAELIERGWYMVDLGRELIEVAERVRNGTAAFAVPPRGEGAAARRAPAVT